MIDTGKRLRLDLLQRDAEQKILAPLRTHGWAAAVEQEVFAGEYLIIAASRGAASHKIALLYSCATDNAVYRRVATQVQHIYFNGQPYMQESFAHGLDKPVESVEAFHALLLDWNQSSSDGKFAAVEPKDFGPVGRRPMRLLLSEAPIDAVWLRVRQLQSVTLAERMIAERARREGVELESSTLRAKAEGISYALRNAADYFKRGDEHAVGQRVVNLYYGALAFAFAEILALPKGADTLDTLESSTKQGHGLYTFDGDNDGAQTIVVGALQSGFFLAWMNAIGIEIVNVPSKRPRTTQDLTKIDPTVRITIEELFATLPEVSDLFADIFDSPPRWVHPAGDMEANLSGLHRGAARPTRSYIRLVDQFGRLSPTDIAAFPGPISDIQEVDSKGDGRHFRVLVDHAEHPNAWGSLALHHSPFTRSALLLPIFQNVGHYRVVCVVLLYALSIIVRYRPSLWRRIQDGDLDHLRALIEAFLAVAERVLPQAFLETVTGQPVFAKQPGSF